MSDKNTIYLMGNAHIDPAWLWRWPEGYGEAKATFRSALDRMREFDDFVFTASSACYYKWIEEDEPEMFAEIHARVLEGRWVLAGGWWIEPDCNMPSGESFARQGLHGQRYFLSRFGRLAETGYNIDSFGHHGNLPQILLKSGLRNYLFARPGQHEKTLDRSLFRWEGIDGSRVLAFRIPTGYATNNLEALKTCLTRIEEIARAEGTDKLLCYGVGNHGGGPTIEMLSHLTELRKRPNGDRLVFAGPDAFFSAVRDAGYDLPVLRDDLQHHASGCYAAHSGMKRANRKTENALLSTEKYACLAAVLTGAAYPCERLAHAWEGLLFNQFHDLLCGCSIRAVHEDALTLYGECQAIAQRETVRATQRISYRIDTLMGADPVTAPRTLGAPIVAFNPLPWPVRVPVRVPTLFRLRHGERSTDTSPAVGAFDDAGNMTPIQPIQCRHRLWDDQDGIYLADVPAFGYALRYVRPVESADTLPASPPPLTVRAEEDRIDQPMCKTLYGGVVLENQHLRIEIDRISGAVRVLQDKRTGVRLIDGPAARGLVIEDWQNDTWGHGVTRFADQVGQFGNAEVSIVEQGPVRCMVRSRTCYGDSVLTQEFVLYEDADQLRVEVKIDWREKHKILKLAFPVAVTDPRSFYEIPFGMIERPCNGEEEPGLNWIAVCGKSDGKPCGLTLLNDGKYSFSVQGGALYADHGGIRRDEEEYDYLDQGIQPFIYALKPFTGKTPPALVVRAGMELNTEFETVHESYHGGPLPRCASHLGVSADNIIVTAVKRAEDNDGYILRACETEGRRMEARIECALLKTPLPLAFAPFEVKTVKIGDDGSIRETDLLELPWNGGARPSSPA
jgi:alpha-mannosidase